MCNIKIKQKSFSSKKKSSVFFSYHKSEAHAFLSHHCIELWPASFSNHVNSSKTIFRYTSSSTQVGQFFGKSDLPTTLVNTSVFRMPICQHFEISMHNLTNKDVINDDFDKSSTQRRLLQKVSQTFR